MSQLQQLSSLSPAKFIEWQETDVGTTKQLAAKLELFHESEHKISLEIRTQFLRWMKVRTEVIEWRKQYAESIGMTEEQYSQQILSNRAIRLRRTA